jgi:hypothetical protein
VFILLYIRIAFLEKNDRKPIIINEKNIFLLVNKTLSEQITNEASMIVKPINDIPYL